jgi:hypothetical protein
MKLLEITEPYRIRLSLNDQIDLSDMEIRAVAPMDYAVSIEPVEGQALETTVKLGIVNGAGHAKAALTINNISISFIDVLAIRGAVQNGLTVYQVGDVGTFANQIKIGSIRHNGENGLLIASPTGGMYGVQGNQFQIGQIISNGHSGIAIFGKESAWNYFQIGACEWNGYFGIYDDGRENIFTVANTNTNPMCGIKPDPTDIVSGHFSDGVAK